MTFRQICNVLFHHYVLSRMLLALYSDKTVHYKSDETFNFCTVEMSYLQHMGVAVVISFVRALETEIPLGVILPPPPGGYERL